jgi:hypothetical protein
MKLRFITSESSIFERLLKRPKTPLHVVFCRIRPVSLRAPTCCAPMFRHPFLRDSGGTTCLYRYHSNALMAPGANGTRRSVPLCSVLHFASLRFRPPRRSTASAYRLKGGRKSVISISVTVTCHHNFNYSYRCYGTLRCLRVNVLQRLMALPRTCATYLPIRRHNYKSTFSVRSNRKST